VNDPKIGCSPRRVVKQGTFTNAPRSTHDEDPTLPRTRIQEQLIDPRALLGTPNRPRLRYAAVDYAAVAVDS
jgi:hypothetical protein